MTAEPFMPLPPALLFFAGALLAGLTRGGLRRVVLVATPLVGAVNLYYLEPGSHWQFGFLGYVLTHVRVDRLSILFGILFHLAAFIGVVFSLHLRDRLEQAAGLGYAGSALGAVFAGDMVTLFVYWELLALTSVGLIWARRTVRANAAGLRYLVIQVFSGLLLLAGSLVRLHQTGTIGFDFIGLDGLGSWLIFIAFGIKCAFPFLHNWLTDSYPEATPTGTVFLSSFTTKAAVYALARAFPGTEPLIYIGTAMTVFPIFYAVIENDLRRVLAYSMINQIGFMVVGIGLGTELALNGAVSHAFNDVIFKGLLFMSMGSVLHMTGRINGSDLGGLYKTMPMTAGFCMVGAASISAFPLFSGFVSKSMVMAAALEQHYDLAWFLLLFASAGVFHHAGIKIPFFAFYARDSGIRAKDPPWNMILAMALAAVLSVFNGSYPWVLYGLLPFSVDYVPYTATHVITQMQLLFFSAAAFSWLKLSGLYPPELRSVNIDAEWTYRYLAPRVIGRVAAVLIALDTGVRRAARARLDAFVAGIFRTHGPQGVLARTWPTGSTVLWVAILLGLYLVLYY